ncbi:MAG TPA: hypothetical protein VIC86_09445 [Acidimicrobiales bacterium]
MRRISFTLLRVLYSLAKCHLDWPWSHPKGSDVSEANVSMIFGPFHKTVAALLLLGSCLIFLVGATPRAGAAMAGPSYSATGICAGGVPAFVYSFYGLPPGQPTTVTLSIYDSPDAVATGTPIAVGPGVSTVLWNTRSPFFGPGQHVIAVHIGAMGVPATNLAPVSPWPISNAYALTLPLCGTTPSPFVAVVATPDSQGYWQSTADGQVLAFGDAPTYGSMSGLPLNHPIVGMESTPDGKGYWLVASDGGVFAFGDAPFYGSTGGMVLNQPVVGMATTRDGRGYFLVASDGGVFSFGDAGFQGSMGSARLNQPVVGMALDPSTGGYWLVAADGGVFSFGAPFLGSTGDIHLNRPVIGIETSTGTGYRLVADDGGVFTFGASPFLGSLGAAPPTQPIVGIASSPGGAGYTMIASDGGIFPFGRATNLGSVSGALLVS